MSHSAFERDCCPDPDPDSGGNALYRQARARASGALVNVYLPDADVDLSGGDFKFYWQGDCYFISAMDGVTDAPANVPDGWEVFDTTGEETNLCGATVYYYQAMVLTGPFFGQIADVTSNALNAVNSAKDAPSATYDVSYFGGAMRFDKINHPDRWYAAGQTLRDGAGTLIGSLVAAPGYYGTDAAASAAGAAQPHISVNWTSGAFYIRQEDSAYGDNDASGTYGAPKHEFNAYQTSFLVDLWKTGVTLPHYFRVGGVVYVIRADAPVSASPGTIVSGETVLGGDPGLSDAGRPENLGDYLAPVSVSGTINVGGCYLAWMTGSAPGTSGTFGNNGRTYSYVRGASGTGSLTYQCPNAGDYVYTLTRLT